MVESTTQYINVGILGSGSKASDKEDGVCRIPMFVWCL